MSELAEVATAVISSIALIVSIAALSVSRRGTAASEKSADAAVTSADAAKKSTEINVAMFKRQGVTVLHEAWREIHAIDSSKPITPHVVYAANVLNLTAAMWNHDIIEREILHQLFWGRFKLIYESMKSNERVPGLPATLSDMLTEPITYAYYQMQEYASSKVSQTKIV